MLFASHITTPLGQMLAIADMEALYLLEFTDCRGFDNEIEQLKEKTGAIIAPGKTKILISIEQELQHYFAGTLREFKTPIALLGTPFQHAVWTTLQKIPFGNTGSYAQVACAIGMPTAFRAVANANGKNRLAIIIPCHRIIKRSGDLCGYNGGLMRKQWLINHEKNQVRPS
jgi:AraC family transcriptional regulator of adaptative response/methylated-DNA-[protein]-cysteine methyltransferase